MQNRNVGDVGDYGKYALLRRLCGPDKTKPVRLGVIWCLFPDESATNDGKHISYLDNLKFAPLDHALYRLLTKIVREAVEASILFVPMGAYQHQRSFVTPQYYIRRN
jgi:hypothetical protein